jgi:hypothetical protein
MSAKHLDQLLDYSSPFLRHSSHMRQKGSRYLVSKQNRLCAGNWIFGPFSFADFATFLTYSNIPSVTRDRLENILNFWAL